MAVSKPVLTEFGVHYRLESCDFNLVDISVNWKDISLKYRFKNVGTSHFEV